MSIGSAAETALTQAEPPATPGKIFWIGAPALNAAYASLGVWQPGMITMLLSAAQVTTSGTSTGATRNSEPASIAALASGMSITVPHPIITLPSYLARKSDTRSRQPGVVSVNSTMSKPPSIAACAGDQVWSTVPRHGGVGRGRCAHLHRRSTLVLLWRSQDGAGAVLLEGVHHLLRALRRPHVRVGRHAARRARLPEAEGGASKHGGKLRRPATKLDTARQPSQDEGGRNQRKVTRRSPSGNNSCL